MMSCQECIYHRNDEVTTTYADPEGILGILEDVSQVGYCFIEPLIVPRDGKSPACKYMITDKP